MVLVVAAGIYFSRGRLFVPEQRIWKRYTANRTATVRAVRGNAVYMNDGTVWKMATQPYFLEGDKVHYRYSEPDALKLAFPAEFQEREKKEEDMLRALERELKVPAAPAPADHKRLPLLFYGCLLEDKTNGWSDFGYRITSTSLEESCPKE